MIHQQIARYARKPRRKSSSRRTVTRERPVDLEKYFLAQIFRFVRISREAITQSEHAARVAMHQFLPRRSVAPQAFLYQLGIGLQSVSASQPPSLFGLIKRNAFSRRKVPWLGGILATLAPKTQVRQ
jgi:hypothetical protein